MTSSSFSFTSPSYSQLVLHPLFRFPFIFAQSTQQRLAWGQIKLLLLLLLLLLLSLLSLLFIIIVIIIIIIIITIIIIIIIIIHKSLLLFIKIIIIHKSLLFIRIIHKNHYS